MTTNFSFDEIDALNFTQQKEYIKKYFIPLKTGDHAIFENEKWKIVDDSVIRKVYFNRLANDLSKFYFKEYKGLREVVCQLNKPTLFDDKLNVCPKIKATYKPYKEFDESTKNAVKLFLSYIHDILASRSKENYEYLLKWYANMLKGNKNDSVIYYRGAQGIGKSTISDFLKHHVLGLELFLESGSQPLKNKFNTPLLGKLMVQFTELENFSVSEWAGISSVLKRYSTSNTYVIEGKGENPIQVENINNYTIDSNNDSLKEEGRRIYIADVSTERKEDKVYYGNIHKVCFNDTVGDAFYSYMLEYNTEGFIPQDFPITKSKLSSITKRLDSAYEFLKQEYILQNKGIKEKPKELFDLYVQFCKTNDVKYYHKKKEDFITVLSNEKITYRKTNGTHYYVVSHETLMQIANKNNWIHELDEMNEKADEEPEIDDKNEELHKQIEDLKAEVERLKTLIPKPKPVSKIFPVVDLIATL